MGMRRESFLEPLAFLGAPLAGMIVAVVGVGTFVIPTPRGSPDIVGCMLFAVLLAVAGAVLGLLAGVVATSRKTPPSSMIWIEALLSAASFLVWFVAR